MKKIVLPAIASVLFLPPLFAIDLPGAPQGFTWQQMPELKAAVLKPDGWFFKREESKGTLAYFITREDLDQNGQFETGLTVNVFRLKKDSAVERGRLLIENMAATKNGKVWNRTVGTFQEFGSQLKDTDASGSTIMQALAIANPKTNTLYLFIFESAAPKWDAAWQLGKQIMDNITLDDGV
jgi:hypothetical protein